MATMVAPAARISLKEYMQTTYRPDCEFIDGEVRERNVGKWEHARLQNILGSWFRIHEREWRVMSATEWRTQVSETRVRVPDLVLVRMGRQPEVLVDPPVLIVEILSPADTYADLQERSVDYSRMGVDAVWIIDPKTRTGRCCIGDTWTVGVRLTVPGTPIFVDLDSLFAELDEHQKG